MLSPELTKALEAAGISTSSLDRVRLSRGVVGKSAYVASAALLVLAVAAYSLKDQTFLLCIAILAVILFALFFVGALFFAHKNPGLALLEGAELIQWRQMDMAAKSVPMDQQLAQSAQMLVGGSGSAGK